MNRKAISKRLLAIHGAVSLTFLLLISWSIWTGILSLYADLARPWLRADVAAAYDKPIATPSEILAFVHPGGDAGPRWNLVAPTPMRPFYVYAGPIGPHELAAVLMVNPATGLKGQWNNLQMDGLFRRIHTDLLLPKPWGRFIMGLAGVFLTILVGGGLFIHGKQIREAWKWRRHSRILDLSESHKRIGLWLTPFLLVMAMTGAILGMKIVAGPTALYLMGPQKVADTQHDKGKRTAPPPATVVGPDVIDVCVERAGIVVPNTRFAGIAREGDLLSIRLLRLQSLQWSGEGGGSVQALCDLATSRVSVTQTEPSGGMWGVIESALRPIHYARFGGIGVVTIYILLSLLCLWVIDSGMKLMWLRQKGNGSQETIVEQLYHANNRLYVVLPLILLSGNLVFGVTPWLAIGLAAVGIIGTSLSPWRSMLTSPIPLYSTAACYALVVGCRHIMIGAADLSAPVIITDATLILMAMWLLRRRGRLVSSSTSPC